MKQSGAVLLVVIFFISDVRAFLLNSNWTGYIGYLNGTNGDKDEDVVSFPATVPGGVYTDLQKKKLIPENLVGDNDVNNRWVGESSFTYVTKFEVNEDFMKSAAAVLVFHGVDTFATVLLNNNTVGQTSNMFIKYRFNVKENLKLGENELRVVFDSAVKVAKRLYEEQSLKYEVPPQCVPKLYNGECHVNHIRKMQASFAWDWGPAFPSIGIWKEVEILHVNKVLVTDMTADVYRQDNSWDVVINVFLMTVSAEKGETIICNLLLELGVEGGMRISESRKYIVTLDGNPTNVSLVLNVPDDFVKRWWPNGYGDQNLYPLSLDFTASNQETHRSIRIGFRTVELVQESLRKGLSFYFKVNNVPIFAKGSNWIPSSIFPELGAKERTLRHLLKSAKDTHMNMLRVWGGGVYESDLFYELADEYGILIWQDFMFACSMYPTTDSFLESVRQEVLQNVRRLQYHASIALWAGNNENEAALYGNWYGTDGKLVYKQDYIDLYVDVIREEVLQLDPTRSFVVSSPSDGLYTDENNFIGPDPYSNLYGDVHYYNYFENGWNINQYPKTRFASEYGFQSIPSIHTMASAARNLSDLELNSEFMRHRQHLLGGYESMSFLIAKNIAIPKSGNATRDFIDYIYLSQVNQAMSVKIETESYRQGRSTLSSRGEGMTMGALYWQLNDVWQAPSWSSIEFGGRWKMLHYYALEFFAPVIVTPRVSSADELEVYIVSDKLSPIPNCTLTLNIYNWNSTTPIHVQNISEITINPNEAKLIARGWFSDYLRAAGCSTLELVKKTCVLELLLEDKNGSSVAPANYAFPGPLKEVNLPLANITVEIDPSLVPGELSNYPCFRINLTSSKIALFVWLDLGSIKGRFSENGFHIFRGRKTVVFHADEATTREEILGSLTVTSLSDVYKSVRKTPHFSIGEKNSFTVQQ